MTPVRLCHCSMMQRRKGRGTRTRCAALSLEEDRNEERHGHQGVAPEEEQDEVDAKVVHGEETELYARHDTYQGELGEVCDASSVVGRGHVRNTRPAMMRNAATKQ